MTESNQTPDPPVDLEKLLDGHHEKVKKRIAEVDDLDLLDQLQAIEVQGDNMRASVVEAIGQRRADLVEAQMEAEAKEKEIADRDVAPETEPAAPETAPMPQTLTRQDDDLKGAQKIPFVHPVSLDDDGKPVAGPGITIVGHSIRPGSGHVKVVYTAGSGPRAAYFDINTREPITL